jgi:hypothetical protein
MFNRTLKHSVAALAAAAGLLAAAGPASAILYNGHAGLGSAAYHHNQTDLEDTFAPQGPGLVGVTDGTSNTLESGLWAGR